MELLYEHHADVNAENIAKNTPLHYAALGGKNCTNAFHSGRETKKQKCLLTF